MRNISEANRNGMSRSGPLIIMVSVVLGMLILCVPVFMLETFAADTRIATMNGESYWNFNSLVSDLEDKNGKTVTIEMLRDWDSKKDDRFNRALNVPRNCNLTINMHGHMFNRNNAAEDKDYMNGELIYVYPGATLTINGYSTAEEKETMHSGVAIFDDTGLNTSATARLDVKGGCLAGGDSYGGTGGIYIDSGKDVTLNDVTIAGCKAFVSFVWPYAHSGYGGGIIITESGTKLVMNNSTVTGCLAEKYGGGIYAQDDNNVEIELNNSHVDKNYANKGGGGINIDGQKVSVSGKNKSSISNNKTEGYGGGVYYWNGDTALTADKFGDIVIDGNEAEEGGGVYLNGENNYLEDLSITNNKATEQGGGIYVNQDIATINTCIITGSSKCGVYITTHCDVDMLIKGATIINDNKDGNLVLENDTSYLKFEQNKDMDVHIKYNDLPDDDGCDITKEVTQDYTDQLTADNSGYEVVYTYRDTDQDDGRRIRYIKKSQESDEKGRHRAKPDKMEIATQDIHANTVSTKVYAGGYTADEGGSGTRYQLRSICAHHTNSGDKDFQTYYTDGFFFGDPIIYNDHLATASYGLASTGAYLDSYSYEYKHIGARQFMSDIGCPDQRIFVNESNSREPGTDSIGVTIGSKTLQRYKDGSNVMEDTDYILVAVGIRSANYGKEWASNVTLGDGSKNDGEAQGFTEAADQTMQAIDYYISRYELQDEIHQGRVKFWIAGFSRGGATANLTAKRLIEKYCVGSDDPGDAGNEVFAYTLEAPKGGTNKGEHLSDKTQYYRIHNLINTCDLVPYVGPSEMGFKRYGVDHYIPGSYIGIIKTREEYFRHIGSSTITPKGDSSLRVTTYEDNAPYDTKKNIDSEAEGYYNAYVSRRDKMVRHLATINNDMRFSDYFYPYSSAYSIPPIKKKGDFDGAKLEDYLPNLMAFLQQEGFKRFSSRYSYRNNYAVNKVHLNGKDYDTLQELARAYFSTDGDKDKKFPSIISGFEKIFDSLWNDLDIALTIGRYWGYDQDKKESIIEDLWDKASDAGAFNDLTQEEIEVVHTYWFTIVDTALNFANGDWLLGSYGEGEPAFPTGTKWVAGWPIGSVNDSWWEDRVIYSATLKMNMDTIININHDRGVGIAWARTYDSYFSDPKTGEMKEPNTEFHAHWVNEDDKYNPDNYTVDAPKAYVNSSEPNSTKSYKQLEETKANQGQQFNTVSGGQRILLEVGEIYDDVSPAGKTQGAGGDVLGEAVFYEIIDITDEAHPKPLLRNNLYRGGVDLPRRADGGKYKITTYAMSLGKTSEKAIYYISVGHKVTIDNGSGEDPVISHHPSNEIVTASAAPADDRFFRNWTVALLDESGATVEEDIADIVLGDKKYDVTASFSMPVDGREYASGKSYPAGYALKITAVCSAKISSIKADPMSDPSSVDITPVTGGDPLQESTLLEFTAGNEKWIPTDGEDPISYPIAWSYTYDGKTYPATGIAYDEVEYTATITAPQDAANAILFAQTGSLNGLFGGSSERLKDGGISVSRDDADGSATISITFIPTDDSHAHVVPQEDVALNIRTVDLNLQKGELAVTYKVHQDAQAQYTYITIPAPAYEDERFISWELAGSGIKLDTGYKLTDRIIKVGIPVSAGSEYTIDAQYIPVISTITAKVDTPLPQQKMQTEVRADTLKVRITDEYEIHPDYVKIEWSPKPLADGTADYLTSYTATIGIVPDKEGKLKARKTGSTDYLETTATFLYSEDLTATIDGDAATVDTAHNSVSYTFPVTTYEIEKVYQPEDVTGIPYGTSEEALREYLPLIEIELDNGSTVSAAATWGNIHEDPVHTDPYDKQIWVADGTVQLPYGVENPGSIDLNVSCKLIVAQAESVKRAVPSVDPGEYLEDQRVELASETKGAEVYWTADPQATDDISKIRSDSKWKQYNSDSIELNRADATEDEIGPDGKPTGRKKITLRAAAFKDGMRPDGPRAYAYVFANEIEIPKGRDSEYSGYPQIGVNGNKYYTLESVSEGVTIDDNGDAIATEPGTYQVKAKINDGFRWEIIDPETGEKTYTTDDQIITFKIAAKPGKLEKVYPPEDVTGIPYGTSKEELVSYLPHVMIQLDDGSTIITAVNWGNLKKELGPDDKYSMQIWTAYGEVQLPQDVENPYKIGLGVTAKLLVDAAGIEVPEGHDSEYNGKPKKGVYGDKHYTLEPVSEGVSIDDDGDAAATEPGTYKVKAKINDGFRWEIIDPKTGEATYTTDDQTVAFSIIKGKPAPPVDPRKKGANVTEIYDPKLPKVSVKAPSGGKKYVRAKWKKLSRKKRKRISGIEVQYARNRKFTKGTGIVKTGKGKTSKKIKKLARKKTYYVRARTIRQVDNVKYYGKWSAGKKVKTK